MSKRNLVIYKIDLDKLEPLTAKQNRELKALADMPEGDIDTSDIPPLSEEFWQKAARNPYYKPVKQQVTIRLDADVLAWLRGVGPKYQTKLNAILREAMAKDLAKRSEK